VSLSGLFAAGQCQTGARLRPPSLTLARLSHRARLEAPHVLALADQGASAGRGACAGYAADCKLADSSRATAV